MNGTHYYFYPGKHLNTDTLPHASLTYHVILDTTSTEVIRVDENYTWAVLPTSETQKKKIVRRLRVCSNRLDSI